MANHRLSGSNKSSAKRECLRDRSAWRGRSSMHTNLDAGGETTARHWRSQASRRFAAIREPHILAFDPCSLVKELCFNQHGATKNRLSNHPSGIPSCWAFMPLSRPHPAEPGRKNDLNPVSLTSVRQGLI